MKFKSFEEIIAWQKSQDFAMNIYNSFGSIKDLCFKDQKFRALVSISNNIARGSTGGSTKEFKRFLNIASASCSET